MFFPFLCPHFLSLRWMLAQINVYTKSSFYKHKWEESLDFFFTVHPKQFVVVTLFFASTCTSLHGSVCCCYYFFRSASSTSNQLKLQRLDALNFFPFRSVTFLKTCVSSLSFLCVRLGYQLLQTPHELPKTLQRKIVNTETFLSQRFRSEKLKSCFFLLCVALQCSLMIFLQEWK